MALGTSKITFPPKWEGEQHEGSVRHIYQEGYAAPGNAPWSNNFAPQYTLTH